MGFDGCVANCKARLVAQGYFQISGVDYDKICSPVIRSETGTAILALSVEHDLRIHQLDVSSAFLNGNLDETIYAKQSEEFVVKGKEDHVCKLNKSLYDLKRSPRC